MTGFHATLPHRTHSSAAAFERGCEETGNVRMCRVPLGGDGDEGSDGVIVHLDCVGNSPGTHLVVPRWFLRKALGACVFKTPDEGAEAWTLEWKGDIHDGGGLAIARQSLEIGQAEGRVTDRSGRPRNAIWLRHNAWLIEGVESGKAQNWKHFHDMERGGSRIWMTVAQFGSVVRSVLRDFGRGEDMTDREILRMKGEFPDSIEGVMERFEAFLDCLDHDPKRPFPCAWLVREQGERAVEALVKLGVDRDDAQGGYVDWSLTNRKFRDRECYLHPSNRERIRMEEEREREAMSKRSWDGFPPREEPS